MIKKCFISGLICSVYNVSIGFIHCILQNNKLLGSKVINVSYNNKTVILKRQVLLVEEMRNTRMKQVICPPPPPHPTPTPKIHSFIAYSYFKDASLYRFSVVKWLKLLIFDHKHNNTAVSSHSDTNGFQTPTKDRQFQLSVCLQRSSTTFL